MSQRNLVLLVVVLLIGGAAAFLYSTGLFSPVEEDLGGGEAVLEEDAGEEEGLRARREMRDESTRESGTAVAEQGDEASMADDVTGETGVVTGRAVTSKGKPASGLDVLIRSTAGERLASGKSGEDGSFSIKLVTDTAARLRVLGGELVSLPVTIPRLLPGQELDVGDVTVSATTTVRVEVKGVTGKPLKGAEVALVENAPISEMNFDFVKILSDVFREDQSLFTGVTGESGSFVFEDVPAGDYAVRASAPNHQLRFSDSVRAVAGAAPPRVEIKLAAGHVMKGRVVDENGSGIRDAVVALLPQPKGMPTVFKSIKARSGADGRFQFTSLGPEQHILLARAEGYTPHTDERQDFDDEEEVTIRLTRGITVSGRVFDTATGDGLPYTDVYFFGMEGTMVEGTTDAEGRYELKGVPKAKNSMILARKDGYSVVVPKEGRSFFGPGGMPFDTESVGGAVVKDIPMTSGGVVEGRVFDQESGEGLAGARVRILNPQSFRGGTGKQLEGVTGADGRYRIERVPVGGAMAVASMRGYVFNFEQNVGIFERQEDMPQVAAGATLNLDVPMSAGATVSGEVVSPAGDPVAGATVNFVDRETGFGMVMLFGQPGGGEQALTNADGRFDLVGVPLKEGIMVTAAHPDYVEAQETIDMQTGRVAELRLQLSMGATLRGVVRNTDGSPASSLILQVDPERQRAIGQIFEDDAFRASTDSRGRFEITRLPPGKATIRLGDAEDHTIRGESTVTLVDGEVTNVTLELEEMVTIEGRVVDLTGRGVADCSISAQSQSASEQGAGGVSGVSAGASLETFSGWATTDSDGRFVIRKIRPDQVYTLQVSKWSMTTDANGGTDWGPAFEPMSVEDVESGATDLVIEIDYKE